VSKRLSDLETAVDTALLYRHSRGVDADPAGESLLHHARTVLFSLERMQGELSEYAEGVRGHVRMHANISAIVQFLPEDLGAFARAHSQASRSTCKNTSPPMCCTPCRKARPTWASATPAPCHGGRELQSRPTGTDQLVLIVPVQATPCLRKELSILKTVLDWDIVGLHANSSISLAMRQPPLPLARHAPAHPGHRARCHVPHDRQRPGRGRDARPRL
jgi:DNA-binding transcriptional LysR family regulator